MLTSSVAENIVMMSREHPRGGNSTGKITIYNNPLAARLKAKHIKALQVSARESGEYNNV